MTTTRAIASNTIVQAVGKALTVGLSLALIAILGRLLGIEGLGAYTTALAFLSLVAIFADFGFFTILVRELSLPSRDQAHALGNVLTLRFLLALGVYAAGYGASFAFNYPPLVLLGIAILLLGQFAQTMQNTLIAVLQARLQMRLAVIADVVSRGLLVALVAWIAARGGGLVEVFWITTVAYVVGLLITFVLTNRLIPVRLRVDLAYWRYLVVETLPLGVSAILSYLYFKIDTLMLSVLKGVVEVGIYGVPFRILEVLIALPGFFVNSVFPVLTNLYERGDEKWKVAFQQSFDFLALLAFPVVVGGLVLAEPLVGIAGPEFLDAYTVTVAGVPVTPVRILQVLIVGVGFSYLSFAFSALILAAGKQRWLVVPNIGYAAFNIGLNLLLIPRWSYAAAAGVTVATEFLILLVSVLLARRLLTFPLRLASAGKAFAVSLVMGSVLLAVPGASLWLELPLGVLTYGVGGWLIGVLDPDVLQALVRRKEL
ncbi:MAG: flippase [Patescibacteria group bacterium]